MKHFTVLKVQSVNPFASAHGQMFGFNLEVKDDAGEQGVIGVNAKSKDAYAIGKDFWAVPQGREFKGIPAYKRVQAPDGAPTAPQSRSEAPSSQFGHGASLPPPLAVTQAKPMPYADAVLLIKRLLDDFGAGSLDAVFAAILDGKVENPVKPKTTVRFMGTELETEGINQAQWDRMIPLCERYAKLTDDKALRALLIATCQVQTRKALTFDSANLFLSALELAIDAEESKQAPTDDTTPF